MDDNVKDNCIPKKESDEERKKWIITIACSASTDTIKTKKIIGTRKEIRHYLWNLVKEDRDDDDGWKCGTENETDFCTYLDNSIYGYSYFSKYSIDYKAIPEEDIEEVTL